MKLVTTKALLLWCMCQWFLMGPQDVYETCDKHETHDFCQIFYTWMRVKDGHMPAEGKGMFWGKYQEGCIQLYQTVQFVCTVIKWSFKGTWNYVLDAPHAAGVWQGGHNLTLVECDMGGNNIAEQVSLVLAECTFIICDNDWTAQFFVKTVIVTAGWEPVIQYANSGWQAAHSVLTFLETKGLAKCFNHLIKKRLFWVGIIQLPNSASALWRLLAQLSLRAGECKLCTLHYLMLFDHCKIVCLCAFQGSLVTNGIICLIEEKEVHIL